jgi:hypothetical protein
MTKILIDIDQEALDRAAAVLRTTTPEDTVNAALRHTVDSHRRLPDPLQARRDVSPGTPHDDPVVPDPVAPEVAQPAAFRGLPIARGPSESAIRSFRNRRTLLAAWRPNLRSSRSASS